MIKFEGEISRYIREAAEREQYTTSDGREPAVIWEMEGKVYATYTANPHNAGAIDWTIRIA